jgi:hypothetical protein
MRICNKNTHTPQLLPTTFIPGHIYQGVLSKGFYLCVQTYEHKKSMVCLYTGDHSAFCENLTGSYLDVTSKVCLDTSKLEK